MTDTKHDALSNAEFEARVKNLAHTLWEQDGRPEGRALEHWFAALDDTRQRMGQGEAETGRQRDDNIDDLGKPINDPDAPALDQPV
jgi:hypothetical protein